MTIDLAGSKVNLAESKGIWPTVLPILFCLSLAAAHWLTLAQPRVQLGGIDSYFYTSLSCNYGELYNRYGTTYYAARVAAIFPQFSMYYIFGTDLGFIILRILLSFGASWAFFLLVRNWFSQNLAYFLTVFLATNPIYTRALAWDYIDGFFITYMFISIGLFALKNSRSAAFTAGVFAAMATNCYLGAFAYLGAFFLACSISNLIFKSDEKLFEKNAYLLLGFVGFYTLISTIIWINFPAWGPFFETKIIKVGYDLARGGSSTWWSPIKNYLNTGQFYFLYPFAVCTSLLAIIFWNKKRKKIDKINYAIAIYLAFVCLGVATQHFILKMPILLFYAIDITLPATFLGAAACLSSIENIKNLNKYEMLCCVILSFFGTQYLNSLINGTTSFIMVCTVLFGIWLFMIANQKTIACILFAIMASNLPTLKLKDVPGLFNPAIAAPKMGKNSLLEKEVVKSGVKLNQTISQYAPYRNGNMKIWFENVDSPKIAAISSMHFYGFGALTLNTKKFNQYNSNDILKLTKDISYLVILSEKKDNLRNGEKALQQPGSHWIKVYENNSAPQNNEIISYSIFKKQQETKL